MMDIGGTSRPATAVYSLAPVRVPNETDVAQTRRVRPAGKTADAAQTADRRAAVPLPENHNAPPSALQLRILSWLDQQASDRAERAARDKPGPEQRAAKAETHGQSRPETAAQTGQSAAAGKAEPGGETASGGPRTEGDSPAQTPAATGAKQDDA